MIQLRPTLAPCGVLGLALVLLSPLALPAQEDSFLTEEEEALLADVLGPDPLAEFEAELATEEEAFEAFLAEEDAVEDEGEPTGTRLSDEELDAILAEEFSPWEFDLTMGLGLGYKENVYLASEDNTDTQVDRPFFVGELEAFLVRLPFDGLEAYLYAFAETRRYTDLEENDYENIIITQGQFLKPMADGLRLGLRSNWFYAEQIFDATGDDDDGVIGEVIKQQHAEFHTLAEWTPHSRWTVFTEVGAQGDFYEDTRSDYHESDNVLKVRYTYGHRSRIELISGWTHRWYKNRLPRDPDGDNADEDIFPGELEFDTFDNELELRHFWDEDRRWETRVELHGDVRVDNGPGYYDYTRYGADLTQRWNGEHWRFEAEIYASRQDWDVREVQISRFPSIIEIQWRETVGGRARVEWEPRPGWTLLALYDIEDTTSNSDFDVTFTQRVTFLVRRGF